MLLSSTSASMVVYYCYKKLSYR